MVIARTGWSGELSYELYLQNRKLGNKLFDMVHDAAVEFNGRVIAPNTIRTIEGGILSYGSDFGREHNPFTIGLGRLVDVDQETDFIGKEALKKIKENGLTEKLVGLELEGEAIKKAPENFWRVTNDDKKIGRVSRAFSSPRLQKNIALAIVDIKYIDLGTKLQTKIDEKIVNCTVVEKPFFDPKKKIALS